MLRVEPTSNDIDNSSLRVESLPRAEKTYLVDASLYMPVMSPLEHSITSVCKQVLRSLYGEAVDRERSMIELLKLLDFRHRGVVSSCELEGPNDPMSVLIDACTSHVAELRRHLMAVARNWANHLSGAYDELKQILGKTTRDMNELECVRDKYIHKATDYVSAEFAKRVTNLSQHMEREFDRIRGGYPDLPSRTNLERYGTEVETLFRTMMKNAPSSRLRQVREFYESQIRQCESEACEELKNHAGAWSEGLVMQTS
jgi:hypothetical protein